jgi:hypothetical protein
MIDDQAGFESNIRYDPHKTSETAIQEELREQLVATGRSVVAPLVSLTIATGLHNGDSGEKFNSLLIKFSPYHVFPKHLKGRRWSPTKVSVGCGNSRLP